MIEAWFHRAIESAAGCKAYPAYVPKDAVVPFVYFIRSSTEREHDLIGPCGLPVATFSVAVFAGTYLQAKKIADMIRRAVDNFSGAAGDFTVHQTRLTGEADGSPEFFSGEDVPTYNVEMAFDVRFEEAT